MGLLIFAKFCTLLLSKLISKSMFFTNLGDDESYLLANDEQYFKNKMAFAKIFGYIAVIAYFAYSIANYFYGDYWAFGLELVLAFAMAYALYDLHVKKRLYPGVYIGIFTGMIILWQNINSGGFGGTGYLWLYIWPLLTFMLGGVRRALVLNVIFYLGLTILFALARFGLLQWEYTDFMVMMIYITLSINIFLLNYFQAKIEGYVRTGIDNRIKIEQLNTVRDKFIDIASLQLHSPLNAIRWNSELLKDDIQELKPELTDRVQDIYSSASLLVNKLTDMKFAVDIKQESVSISINQFDLVDVVRELIKEMEKSFPEKQVTLEVLGFSKGNLITSDKEKLTAIVSVILDNAFRYTKKTGKIDVSLVASGGNISLQVRDNGIGIPASEVPHVFDLFVRGSNANTMNPYGTGVGLYVARYFAGQLNILLDVKSHEGKGTTAGLHFTEKIDF